MILLQPLLLLLLPCNKEMYESSLHEQLVKRTPTQHTPTSYERYRADETKLVQNRLLLEDPLLDK